MSLRTLWRISAYPDGDDEAVDVAVTADYAAAAIRIFQEKFPDHAVTAVECLHLELVAGDTP